MKTLNIFSAVANSSFSILLYSSFLAACIGGTCFHSYKPLPAEGWERRDGLQIVDEFPGVTGVFHCFSGSAEFALELVRRGWYIGFTGVLTFKNARRAVEAAQAVPLDRILIETDCPYMAPEPFRGRRCDPRLVRFTAQKLAEIRGITPDEAAEITLENACRLFAIRPTQ